MKKSDSERSLSGKSHKRSVCQMRCAQATNTNPNLGGAVTESERREGGGREENPVS
jgi:hypothetical protein